MRNPIRWLGLALCLMLCLPHHGQAASVLAPVFTAGSGTPSVLLGHAGDYYLNTATYALYQKGAGGAWSQVGTAPASAASVTSVTVSGLPAGSAPTSSLSGGVLALGIPAGQAGTNGANGVAGPAGAIGPAGPTGNTGATGPAGSTGPIGPAGPTGPTGANGTNGTNGASGATGATGPAGPNYPLKSGATILTSTPASLAFGTGLTAVVDGANNVTVAGTGGTVTSVGLSTPGLLYSVSGSPVTMSGTITETLLTQTANAVLAGPSSGTAAAPTFRALVPLDIPSGVAGTGLTSTAGVLNEINPVPLGVAYQTPHMNSGSTALITDSALLDDGSEIGIGGVSPVTTTTLIIKNRASSDGPVLGSELTSTSGWTLGSGWAGDNSVGFTHTTGNIATLTYPITGGSFGNAFQVILTVTSASTGTVVVSVGGTPTAATISTGIFRFITVSSAGIVITPSTDFNGTVKLSVKQYAMTTPQVTLLSNSASSTAGEIRNSSSNVFDGIGAGKYTLSTQSCTGVGISSLASNIAGGSDSAFGASSLYNNSTGSQNTGVGTNSLYSLVSGSLNTAVGFQAGYGASTGATTGTNNTYLGANTANTSATQYSFSTAIGYGALIGASNACIIGGSGANALSVGIGGITAPLAQLHVQSTSITNPVILAQAASGQTAALIDATNSTGTTHYFQVPMSGTAAGLATAGNGFAVGTMPGLTQTVNGTTYTGGIATAYSSSAASVSGPVNAAVVTASTYTVVANVDRFLMADATSNNVALTLPDPTSYSGSEIDVSRQDTSGTNTVTVTTAGTGKTITNYASVTAQYQVRHYYRKADGSGWFGL